MRRTQGRIASCNPPHMPNPEAGARRRSPRYRALVCSTCCRGRCSTCCCGRCSPAACPSHRSTMRTDKNTRRGEHQHVAKDKRRAADHRREDLVEREAQKHVQHLAGDRQDGEDDKNHCNPPDAVAPLEIKRHAEEPGSRTGCRCVGLPIKRHGENLVRGQVVAASGAARTKIVVMRHDSGPRAPRGGYNSIGVRWPARPCARLK